MTEEESTCLLINSRIKQVKDMLAQGMRSDVLLSMLSLIEAKNEKLPVVCKDARAKYVKTYLDLDSQVRQVQNNEVMH